jgi:hypothetical protein
VYGLWVARKLGIAGRYEREDSAFIFRAFMVFEGKGGFLFSWFREYVRNFCDTLHRSEPPLKKKA